MHLEGFLLILEYQLVVDHGTLEEEGILTSVIISLASSSVIGAILNETSLINSTRVPTKPNIIFYPNCASLIDTTITSKEEGPIYWIRTPSIIASSICFCGFPKIRL